MTKKCIIILENVKDKDGNYVPCAITEGEFGYKPIHGWNWGSDFKIAQNFADQHNEKMGVSKEEVEKLKYDSYVSEDKKVAYFISEFVKDENDNYIPCIAREGESGFYKTDWQWGSDIEIAQKEVKFRNEMMGIDEIEAFRIIATTLRKD